MINVSALDRHADQRITTTTAAAALAALHAEAARQRRSFRMVSRCRGARRSLVSSASCDASRIARAHPAQRRNDASLNRLDETPCALPARNRA
jgi:hypothetical protein